MSTKTEKYVDLLAKTEGQISADEIPFKGELAKNDLEKAIINTKQDISKANIAISRGKSSHSFNAESIINAINSKELLERKLKQQESLLAELF